MEITVSDTYDLAELEEAWRGLEARTEGSFFLSWPWIGTWLHSTKIRPLLVKAMDTDSLMALGLLVPARTWRHLFAVRQLCLHETGLSVFDGLMIEHNNFLLAPEAPPGLVTDILKLLQSANVAWDEIVLGGVAPAVVDAAQGAGLRIETDRISPDYGVDLSTLRGPFEESLSANQRAQLRQSRAFAEKMGPLQLRKALARDQAQDFFEKMAALHGVYWRKKGRPGAFATPFALNFHRRLVSDHLETVELSELSAGDEVLGYLYNFRHGGTLSNYQGGFSYGDDNRHRPGLIAHVMAIEQARQRGLRFYDFLAGDAPYKARLGRRQGTLVWCRAQKNRPLLRIESAARKFRQKLLRPDAATPKI